MAGQTGWFLVAALATLIASPSTGARETFRVTSPTVEDGGAMPASSVLNAFGCSGDNRSPALTWSGAPEGTESFAVTLYDPDAPTGSGWWHWVVFDIPASVTSLPEDAGGVSGALPEGAVQSRTDFGAAGYGGPCPPEGRAPHRYVFTVHALAVAELPLDADASGAMVGFFLGQNTLATATLSARYGR